MRDYSERLDEVMGRRVPHDYDDQEETDGELLEWFDDDEEESLSDW